MTINGLRETLAAMEAWKEKMRRKAEVAVKLVCVELWEDAQYLVPVDMGALIGSSDVTMEPASGGGFSTVGIVAYHIDYALWVHEDLDKAHGEAYNIKYAYEIANGVRRPSGDGGMPYKRREPQQQAKFLETPMRDNEAKYFSIVVDTLQG